MAIKGQICPFQESSTHFLSDSVASLESYMSAGSSSVNNVLGHISVAQLYLAGVLLREKFIQRSINATFFYRVFLSHMSAGQVMKKSDFQ